jgi:hypothetical protein
LKSSLATTIAGVMLLIPAAMGLLIATAPTVLGPYPALTALPALFLSSRGVVVLLPTLVFFLWNLGLFRGETKISRKSYILLIIVAILSVIWFVVGWRDGLHYEGAGYLYKVCAINIIWFAFLSATFFWYSRGKKPSFSLNLALNWALFAWLAWYAFPYLGELP